MDYSEYIPQNPASQALILRDHTILLVNAGLADKGFDPMDYQLRIVLGVGENNTRLWEKAIVGPKDECAIFHAIEERYEAGPFVWTFIGIRWRNTHSNFDPFFTSHDY